jgi:hypothetical protein
MGTCGTDPPRSHKDGALLQPLYGVILPKVSVPALYHTATAMATVWCGFLLPHPWEGRGQVIYKRSRRVWLDWVT